MSSQLGLSGAQLEALLRDLKIKKTDLSMRWGVHRATVQRLCKLETLPQPYVDATCYLAIERHLEGLGFDVAKSIQERIQRCNIQQRKLTQQK